MYKFAALFSASMIFASMANAEGFYVGGSFGASEATLSTNTQFADPDDRLYLVKGFGGYRVNDFFAVEDVCGCYVGRSVIGHGFQGA